MLPHPNTLLHRNNVTLFCFHRYCFDVIIKQKDVTFDWQVLPCCVPVHSTWNVSLISFINTQPGMTSLSLVPEIASYKGLSFENKAVKAIYRYINTLTPLQIPGLIFIFKNYKITIRNIFRLGAKKKFSI